MVVSSERFRHAEKQLIRILVFSVTQVRVGSREALVRDSWLENPRASVVDPPMTHFSGAPAQPPLTHR